MNPYGAMAMRHWQTHLPDRFALLNDPERFFTEMGQRAADEVQRLEVTLAGTDTPGEGYLAKLGRLTNARMRAEEIVLREEVLADPSETPRSDGSMESAGMEQDYSAEDWDVWTDADRERNRRAAAQERERERTGWSTTVITPEQLLREEQDDREDEQTYQRILAEKGHRSR